MALISSKLIDDVKEKNKQKISNDLISNTAIFSEEAYNRFRQVVIDNHGIRLNNLFSLFLPIGVDPNIEDLPLANMLDTYGLQRGDFAHSFHGITTELSLSDALAKVSQISNDIEVYDKAAVMTLKKTLK